MLKAWIFEPAGRSTPSGVPEVSRMNTGTSTVGPSAVTVPTVTTSCAAAAPASRSVPRTARRMFFTGLIRLSWARRNLRLDGSATYLQRAGGHGRSARAGGVAQQRQLRIDAHGHARVRRRVELDLGDDASAHAAREGHQIGDGVRSAAADLECLLDLRRAMNRGVAHAVAAEDDAQRHGLHVV